MPALQISCPFDHMLFPGSLSQMTYRCSHSLLSISSKTLRLLLCGPSRNHAGCSWIDQIILDMSILYRPILLKRGCIEFKYYADGIHSGLTPPGNNS